ncbi:hypothetical protein FBU30_001854 [Linnemannia zychae]|nr:hypothetical protein FBU30_001854 [Linnemannia zychae]
MSPSNIKLALDIPEILGHLGTFLTQKDACLCALVSKAWYNAFQPILWEHVETANNIPLEALEKHAHHIRNLSLADINGLESFLSRCTRLRTLVLWPDALEDEEDDDEDEDNESLWEEEEDQVAGSHVLSSLFGDEYAFISWTKVEKRQGPLSCSGDSVCGHGSDTGSEWAQDKEEKDTAVGAWEWDKVRRDSGIGEETAAHALDAEVTKLQIADAVQPYANPSPHQKHEHKNEKTLVPPKSNNSVLAELLLRNPGLLHVEVYVERRSPGGAFWRALSTAEPPPPTSSPTIGYWSIDSVMAPKIYPRLTTFQSLVNLHIHQHIKPFLQMCTRLESLHLEGCTLRQLNDEYYKSLQFPRLKHIKFSRVKDWSLDSQLLFMSQCHELRTLSWHVPRLGFPVQEFCGALQINWPNLVSLTLPESRLNDSDLAKIIQATTSLSTLSIRRSDFGEHCFRALKRHFRTLHQLDLFQCPNLNSRMTQQILENCHCLESFEGNKLLIQDVAEGMWGSSQKGWVCHNLRVLDVHLSGRSSMAAINHLGETVSIQWMVYSQLAEMTNLVHLSIGGKSPSLHPLEEAAPSAEVAPLVTIASHVSSIESYMSSRGRSGRINHSPTRPTRRQIDGLHLSLDDGLDQLSSLRKLRFLKFTGLEQEMEASDVRWMVDHWPDLKILQGKLHSDVGRQDELESLLATHGISAWTSFNQPPLRRFHVQHPLPQH